MDTLKEKQIMVWTFINGSVGGENWCVYGDLNNYCDTASIMSCGMA